MIGCRIARRVAWLSRLALPCVAGASGAALATKVLHLPCQPSRLGVRLRTVGVTGVNVRATSVQRVVVGVRIDAGRRGACRIARRPGWRPTVLTLMFWVTKGRSRSEAAG
jgi:hypothetical protein